MTLRQNFGSGQYLTLDLGCVPGTTTLSNIIYLETHSFTGEALGA